MATDYKRLDLKPMLKTKKDAKVIDPPRYPKVIVPIENEAKRIYAENLESMINNLTKKMVQFVK